jgi:hypothetical protein
VYYGNGGGVGDRLVGVKEVKRDVYGMVIMLRVRERKMKRPCADGTVTPASLMAHTKERKN